MPPKTYVTEFPPARDGDKILLLVPHYWGRGATLDDAKASVKRESGHPFAHWKTWEIMSVHPDTEITETGGLRHLRGHRPITLARRIEKP